MARARPPRCEPSWCAGRIAAFAAPGGPLPEGAAPIDGRGRFLIPGLWDMHVHLATRPEPELAERIMLPLFLAHGVVGVRDMGGPSERVLQLRDRVRAGTLEGPRILAAGPFVDGPGAADPMFRRVTSGADAPAAVKELLDAGVDFIKAQSGLSPEAYTALARAVRTRSAVLAGHIPIALSAEKVAEAGQRSIEHISPALVGDALLLFACSSRGAELVEELRAIERDRESLTPAAIGAREAALRRRLVETYDPARARDLGRTLRTHGTWIVPTLIWSNSLRPVGATDDGAGVPLEYVPAATRARWQQRRAAYLKQAQPADFAAAADGARVSAAALRALHAAGAQVLAGTDTFDGFNLPGVSLHQELTLLVKAGLTPIEALRTATLAAAEYRGTAAHEGTIAPGKRADLVLLDADPLLDIANVSRVRVVIADGRLLDRTALDDLLSRARSAANK